MVLGSKRARSEPIDHDFDGNLIEDGQFKCAWDAENRLIRVEPAGTPVNEDKKVEFKYDYMNRRVEKKVYEHDSHNRWHIKRGQVNRIRMDQMDFIGLNKAMPTKAVVFLLMLCAVGAVLLPSHIGWNWQSVVSLGLLLLALSLCILLLARFVFVLIPGQRSGKHNNEDKAGSERGRG